MFHPIRFLRAGLRRPAPGQTGRKQSRLRRVGWRPHRPPASTLVMGPLGAAMPALGLGRAIQMEAVSGELRRHGAELLGLVVERQRALLRLLELGIRAVLLG